MHTIIFDSYRKYQKENKNIIKSIFRLPCFVIVLFTIIVVSLIISIFSLILDLSRNIYLCCLALEFCTCVVLYFYTEHYQIKISNFRLSVYQNYCAKIYTWLDELGVVTTENNICELKNRIDQDITAAEEKRKLRREIIERWIQILIIPILLAIFSAIIKEQKKLTVIIAYAITLLILLGSLGLAFLSCYNIIDFFKKRELVQLKSFSDDLQGVLDTQFDNQLIKLNCKSLDSGRRIDPNKTDSDLLETME